MTLFADNKHVKIVAVYLFKSAVTYSAYMTEPTTVHVNNTIMKSFISNYYATFLVFLDNLNQQHGLTPINYGKITNFVAL